MLSVLSTTTTDDADGDDDDDDAKTFGRAQQVERAHIGMEKSVRFQLLPFVGRTTCVLRL